jgi:hypothetical protein
MLGKLAMPILTIFLSPCCSAATLSELLAGGEILSGSLRFSNFQYVADAGLPQAGEVTVSPVVDAAGDSGLRFGWIFNPTAEAKSLDATLSYTVETLDAERHLASARMSGDPTGTGIASIYQDFVDLGSLFNFIFARSGSIRHTDDLHPSFFGYRGRFSEHRVVSEISVATRTSAISFFEQTYAVPEPSADFDVDGDVDGTDFLAWQTRLNQSTSVNAAGDANVDGRVNADDLAVWHSQFDVAADSVAAVPEPTSSLSVVALALAISTSGCLRRRAI